MQVVLVCWREKSWWSLFLTNGLAASRSRDRGCCHHRPAAARCWENNLIEVSHGLPLMFPTAALKPGVNGSGGVADGSRQLYSGATGGRREKALYYYMYCFPLPSLCLGMPNKPKNIEKLKCVRIYIQEQLL